MLTIGLTAGLFFWSSCAFIDQLFGSTPEHQDEIGGREVVAAIDSVVMEPDTLYNGDNKEETSPKETGSGKRWDKKSYYQISYILPLHLDRQELDQAMSADKITGMQNLAGLEFYEGALLALDTLKAMGFQGNIHVFDDYRDKSRVEELLQLPDLIASDVVVGPFFNAEMALVSAWSKQNETFVVAPLSPSTQTPGENPYYLMANSSLQTQLEALLQQWITASAEKPNLIVAAKADRAIDSLLKTTFQEAHRELGGVAAGSQLHFLEDLDNLQSLLDNDRMNYVFIASLDELYVNGLMRRLSLLSDNHRIEAGGLASLMDMESLSLDYFEKLHYHYPATYWVNPLSPKLESFKEAYLDKYQGYPSEYAQRGYDLTLYLGYLLMQYGPYLPQGFQQPRPIKKMLFDMQFGQYDAASFYENKQVKVLRFDNYRFELAGKQQPRE